MDKLLLIQMCIHGYRQVNVFVLFCQNAFPKIVGSTDRASSQQLQMWFSEHFLAPKLATWFDSPIVSGTVELYGGTNMTRKMSGKPHSIRPFR